MHTGYTHAHSHTNTASFHSFTLSCLLACCCCVLFPSLFTRRAALRCTACAEQSSCYSHSWETGKKQTITHFSGRRLVQAFTFSHSFRRARSTIALRVHVCARLSLIPSFTVLSRHMCALVYVCFFFDSLLSRENTDLSKPRWGRLCLFVSRVQRSFLFRQPKIVNNNNNNITQHRLLRAREPV